MDQKNVITREQIERLWNDARPHQPFSDMNPETQTDVLRFARMVEDKALERAAAALRTLEPAAQGAMKALDIMMRTYAAAAAWRDKWKVRQGEPIMVAVVVELAKAVMPVIGWFPPDPSPESEVIVISGEPKAEPTSDLGADPDAGHGGYNWGGIGR